MKTSIFQKLRSILSIWIFANFIFSSLSYAKGVTIGHALKSALQNSKYNSLKESSISLETVKKEEISQAWQPTISSTFSKFSDNLLNKEQSLEFEVEQKLPFGTSLKINTSEIKNTADQNTQERSNRSSFEISQTIWPLPHHSPEWNSFKQAEENLSAAKISIEVERQTFLKSTNDLFWDLYLTAKEKSIYLDSFTWSEKEWKRGKLNLKKGAIAKSEQIELEVNMLKSKENLVIIESKEEALLSKLQLVTGLRFNANDLDGSNISEIELDSVLELEYQKSLRWKSKSREVVASETGVQAKKYANQPEIYLSGELIKDSSTSTSSNNELGKTISVGLKYQIPVTQRPAGYQKSLATLSKVKTELHILGIELQQSFSEWNVQLKNLIKLISIMETRFESQKKWVNIEEERYTAGAVTFHDLNHARESLEKVQLSLEAKRVEKNKLLAKVKSEMGLL